MIVVYSLTGCPHCNAAKSKLKELNLNFVDVSIDRFPPYLREWLANATGKTSVPQIFFNSKHIGGNFELQNLIADRPDEFRQLLKDLEENEPPLDNQPLLPNPSEALDFADPNVAVQCEPDKFAHLVEELLASPILKSKKPGLFSAGFKNQFSGRDFVDWLMSSSKILSRDSGVEMGRELLNRKFIRAQFHTEFRDEPDSLYLLISFENAEALNTDLKSDCEQRSASEVGEDLQKMMVNIHAKFLSPDGRQVDYQGIKNSDSFLHYKTLARELQRVKLDSMTKEQKLAFFINVYNALVIHGNIERGTPESLWQRFRFFSGVKYNIGGLNFSLNDIENGILRSNQGNMATLYRTPFKKSDPRIGLALETVDPRIHFALNCGAKSCPPIKTFSATGIDSELEVATQSYLETDEGFLVECDETSGKYVVRLSMLFKWYATDFGASERHIITWISQHVSKSEEKGHLLSKVLDLKEVKVKYIPYDWTHNQTN